MTILFSILILFSFGQVEQKNDDTKNIQKVQNIIESKKLQTGWYYLTDKKNGLERKLYNTNEIYFINPKPIVTVGSFTTMKIYQSNNGDLGLIIRLDENGKKYWREATGKSIGKKLALIIDNELYYTPTINTQIDFGITALNRGDLTKQELVEIKRKIENEINKKARP